MPDNNKLYKRDMIISFDDKETFIEVGGLKTNVNIKNKTYPEILDAILFPYSAPKIVESKYSLDLYSGKTDILDLTREISYNEVSMFSAGKNIKVTKNNNEYFIENISTSPDTNIFNNSIIIAESTKSTENHDSCSVSSNIEVIDSIGNGMIPDSYPMFAITSMGEIYESYGYPIGFSNDTNYVNIENKNINTAVSIILNIPYGCSCKIWEIKISINGEKISQDKYSNTEVSMNDTLLLEYCTDISITNFYGIIHKRSEDIQKYSLGTITDNNVRTFSNFSNLTDINNDVLSNEISKTISNITISNISPSLSKLTDNSVVTEFSDNLKLYIDVYDSTSNSLASSNIIFAPAILYGDIAYDESIDNIKNSIIQNVEESNRKPLLHVTNELFEFSQDTENIVFYILAPKTFGNAIIVKDSNNNQYTWSNIGTFTYQYKSSDTTTDMEYSIFISEKIIDTYLSKTINFIVTVRNGIFSDDKYILNGGNALGNFE